MLIYFILLFILLLGDNEGFKKDNDCPNVNDHHQKYLATKTPYRFISNKNDSVVYFEGCQPIKIWAVIRHGTRNPDEKYLSKMRLRLPALQTAIISNHRQSKGALCDSELINLTLWSPQIELGDQKHLVHEGEDEMLELAERFQNRFPGLLPDVYSNSSFKFRFTATQRTKESQRYFTIGLFGRKESRYVWSPDPLHKDPLLRFYKLCSKWKKEVDKNPEAVKERRKFEESEEMKKVLNEVSSRLGFNNDLHLDDVELMYLTCAFESAWYPLSVSPWCSAFSESNLELLEYAEDLENYWVNGYGYKINYEQACPIIGDMLQSLISEDDPKAIFYFTHSGTLLKVLAHLGLYKDENPLTHDKLNSSRLWRVSKIDAFGTNLAFVLFRCEDGLKVLTLHQERPVQLPGCPDTEVLCPLDKLVNMYHDSLYDCRFSEMCQLDP